MSDRDGPIEPEVLAVASPEGAGSTGPVRGEGSRSDSVGRTVGKSSRAASGLDGPFEADTTGAAGATRGCTTDPLALGDEAGPEGVTATVSGEPGLAELVLGDGDIGVAASPVAVTKGAGVDDAESDGST